MKYKQIPSVTPLMKVNPLDGMGEWNVGEIRVNRLDDVDKWPFALRFSTPERS